MTKCNKVKSRFVCAHRIVGGHHSIIICSFLPIHSCNMQVGTACTCTRTCQHVHMHVAVCRTMHVVPCMHVCMHVWLMRSWSHAHMPCDAWLHIARMHMCSSHDVTCRSRRPPYVQFSPRHSACNQLYRWTHTVRCTHEVMKYSSSSLCNLAWSFVCVHCVYMFACRVHALRTSC